MSERDISAENIANGRFDEVTKVPKFLITARYVGDGVKGLLKEGGSARRDAVNELVRSVGGTLEAFYYAFGEDDAFVIVDVPDNVSGAALSLVVNASGAATSSATVLLTPEDIDAATKKAPLYRPPGK